MLIVENDGPLRRVTLDRPDVRNAFNDDLIQALTLAFSDLPAGTRVILLRGNGPAFCAGGDLQWMQKAANYTREQNCADALKLAALFRAMLDCPAAIVTAVHGAAFGGGCGLVAASDISIALADTKFAFSEVRLGLIPATISSVVVPKIGVGHARALFMTGEMFLAPRAQQIGLVHEVAQDQAELDRLVDAKLKALFTVGPEAVAASKRLVIDYPLPDEETASRLADARAGEEGREGVAAFLEKRKASFVVEWNGL